MSNERQLARLGGVGGVSHFGNMPSVRSYAQQHLPDVAIGQLFQDLRLCLNLSEYHAAMHLQTHPDVIHALENGAFDQLPPWPETCRIVSEYTSLVSIDPGPVLHLIGQKLASRQQAYSLPVKAVQEEQREASGSVVTAFWGYAKARAEGIVRAGDTVRRRMGGLSRPTLRIMVAGVAILVLTGLVAQTTVLQASVGHLPSPVLHFVRDAQDYVLMHLAPTRDGLRWIDVDDPRSRRTDKLRPAKS